MRTNFDYASSFFSTDGKLGGRLQGLKMRRKLQRGELRHGVGNWDTYRLHDYVLAILYNGLEIIIRDGAGCPAGCTDEEWKTCLIDLKGRVGSLLAKDEDPDYYRYIRRAQLSKNIYGENSEEYEIADAQCDWYTSIYWENYKKFKKETFEILEEVWDSL